LQSRVGGVEVGRSVIKSAGNNRENEQIFPEGVTIHRWLGRFNISG